MMDSDYTYPVLAIPEMLKKLDEGADIVMGYRCWKEEGSMPFTNKVGNWLLSWWASLIYQYRVRDVCTGMWAFRTEALKDFPIKSKGFTLEAELFSKAIKGHLKVEQVAISYKKRQKGESKLVILDGLKILWFLFRERK